IPENEKLKGNNIFLIDMGIKYASVCSDLTRTYFTSNPTKKQKKVYDTLYDALEIGISQVKAGISASKPALKAKEVIEENGFEVFGASHVLGHPVGAEVHDVGPGLSPVQEEGTKLKAGQILTFEPGLYYPEEGWGIRLEDNIIVKENKAVRLSKHPKEPVILNI
ncbi:MAG: aminopeptidase P family protein, partial [Candidatus Korarchaeota archaeon]|nr:aminopeptidase P family protein [Candidatus Korarchaeota archaeon]NIU83242.1 M24 family metallopeptidase [Candidatus Thorarchaeota archaeon]NIW13589.1 M24 family metallopeptidase [Candidatus Thorarchaeota archaeon]NIW51695.1 M24 family metallopeptidase [Candidatus Korarchaeota archaeon]